MSNLLYLGLAVLISLVGCGVLWYRNRKPTSVEHGIESFRRELNALSPASRRPERGRRR